MKYKNRAVQRGKRLLPECKRAYTAQGAAGDDRIFCYGLYEADTEEAWEECVACGAWTYGPDDELFPGLSE